jgi:type IV secretion system pilin
VRIRHPLRPPRAHASRSAPRRGVSWIRLAGSRLAASLAVCALVAATTAASVLTVPGGPLAVDSLEQVIKNLRDVIVGLLVSLATLFATIGGIRYILAGGDPGEVEAAKKTLKYAAVGYGVAVLAPVLVKMLQHIVGAP